MKIAEIIKNGRPCWRVNDEQGPGRKRVRKFFPSMAAARKYLYERKVDKQEFGIHIATLTPHERAYVGHHMARLRLAGWTLGEAVDFVLDKGGVRPQSVPLGTVARDFIASKEAKGLRPRSLHALRASVELFLLDRRQTPIGKITAPDIRDFLGKNGWQPATVRSYLGDVRNLFAFAVREGYLTRNPALAVDMPLLDDKPPGILTVTQCRALLSVCRCHEPRFLPSLALCLLAGIRPDEVRRLEWADLLPDHLEVKAHKAKTRRRRLVPITPQLRAWLDLARTLEGELPCPGFIKRFNRARRLSGLMAEWPHDAMRHSFASYHLAKHRNEYEAALVLGNSPQMVFAHYRELVAPAEAEAFFGLLPENCGEAEAAAALTLPAPKPVRTAGRGVRAPYVSLATLRELFRDGERANVPRRELVAELVARGISETTAYAALRSNGHLREYLVNRKGRLSLAPAALAGAVAEAKPANVIPLPRPEGEPVPAPEAATSGGGETGSSLVHSAGNH